MIENLVQEKRSSTIHKTISIIARIYDMLASKALVVRTNEECQDLVREKETYTFFQCVLEQSVIKSYF